MPYITKEQHKKFLELLDKDKKEREDKEKNLIYELNELARSVGGLLDLNKQLGPIEAYARVLGKLVNKQMIFEKEDVLFINWTDMQRYLTDQCLEWDKHGKWNVKRTIRTRLRELGFECRVDRKWNVFKICRCLPKKYVK